jgi:lipoprotein NlpD
MSRSLARALSLCVAAALISGCGGSALSWDTPVPGEHIVQNGETLYSIAWRYGLEVGDLARWNGLGDGSLIRPGQRIVLRPTGAVPTSSPSEQARSRPPRSERPPAVPEVAPPAWQWPTEGTISAGFGEDNNARTGVLIDGRRGQDIYAAADGEVVYAGSGLIGYGNLVIIKHNVTYLSAYGHNEALAVEEGQTVKRGQRIASMGEGPGRRPRLHFEIRRNGDPVDPGRFLPVR